MKRKNILIKSTKLAKVKSDFVKLKNDSISLTASPFNWDTDQINYFLSFLAVLTICFFVDEFVRDYIKTIHNNIFDRIFSFAHWYGKPPLTIYSFIIFYFGGLFLVKDNLRAVGVKIFEAFILSGIIVTIIKSILGRWRPYTEHGSWSFVSFTLGPNDHLSFPSGDVAVAFAFSVIIAGIFDNHRKAGCRLRHKLWKIFWYLLAVLTAIGRIYHDQHWLSDVILASAISIWVGNYINNISKQKPVLS
ncbi:MAG: phosphatase PAP2 family protein [Ignavibacteriaceae bacterium]